MRTYLVSGVGRAGLGATLLLLAAALPARTADPVAPRAACTLASAQSADSRPPCCFTNRAFVGVCSVQPGDKESCASILEYLNDPRSQGKDYCGNTTIRGGWAQADCETKSTAARPPERTAR
jgi:hypothetical protein